MTISWAKYCARAIDESVSPAFTGSQTDGTKTVGLLTADVGSSGTITADVYLSPVEENSADSVAGADGRLTQTATPPKFLLSGSIA